jgi:plastocyanin
MIPAPAEARPPDRAARRRRRVRWLALSLLTAALLGACGDGGAGSEPVATDRVVVDDNRFRPATVQVAEGMTVTWSFQGSAAHDVSGEGWGSGEPQTRGTFTHTFRRAGTYGYRCSLHLGMKGRVVVGG